METVVDCPRHGEQAQSTIRRGSGVSSGGDALALGSRGQARRKGPVGGPHHGREVGPCPADGCRPRGQAEGRW